MARVEFSNKWNYRDRDLYSPVDDVTPLPLGCDGKSSPALRYNGIYPQQSGTFRKELVSDTPIVVYSKSRSDVVKSDGVSPTPYFCDVLIEKPGSYESKQFSQAMSSGYNCGTPFTYTIKYNRESIFIREYYGGVRGATLPAEFNPMSPYSKIADIVYRTALLDIYKKRADKSASFGVTIAEAGKTAKWLELRSFKMLRRIGMIHAICDPKASNRRKLRRTLGISDSKDQAVADYGAYIRLVREDVDLDVGTKKRLIQRAKEARRRFGTNADMFASLYLEYRYALSPLIMEIEDAMKYLVFDRSSYEFTISGECAQQTLKFGESSTSGDGTTTTYVTEGYFAGVMKITCKVTDPLRFTLAEAGLDLTSIPATVWELIPFSWMFDWALGIGDFLEQLSAFTGASFVRGFYSYKLEATTETNKFKPVSPSGYGLTFSSTTRGYQMNARRILINGLPEMIWEIKNPFNLWRLGDVLALTQQFRAARDGRPLTNLNHLRG